MTMGFFWKCKINRKAKRGSRTPGSEKCKIRPLDRYLAKRSRSYKHPEFKNWKRQGIKE